MRRQQARFLCSLALLLLLGGRASAQLSGAVASDDHVSIDGNKYLQNSADLDPKHDAEPRV